MIAAEERAASFRQPSGESIADSGGKRGLPVRIRKTGASGIRHGVMQDLPPEPASMQKYSDEVRDRIATKAYELFEQRGRQDGQDLDDWLRAEEIVMRTLHETGE